MEDFTNPTPRAWKLSSWLVVIAFLARAIWWFYHTPSVGKGGVLLAVAATLLPLFWDKTQVIGKMAWIALLFVLLAVEYHAIDEDHAKSVAAEKLARDTENNHFQNIVNQLTTSIEQNQMHFDATMNRSNAILSDLSNSINLQTGGNGYIYFEPLVLGDKPTEMADSIAPKGSMIANGYMKCVGKFPLHNVYVLTFGPLGKLPDIDYETVFCKELGRPRQGLTLVFQPDKPQQRWNVFINTSNGSYSQIIVIERFGEHWAWASRLTKYGDKKPLRDWNAPEFPKDELKTIWK